MANLTNTWIGYITRSYEQIKADLLTRFQSQIPEMTDHTESNIFVRMLGIWAGITEMLGYYIDARAQESFLSTCRLYESAVKIAKLLDYRIKGYSAASADIRFYIADPAPSDILIPSGTEITTEDGIRFFTVANGTILTATTEITIPAKQRILVSGVNLGSSNGAINQRFVIDDFVVDNGISVLVGLSNYLFKETLAFSIGTDEVFTQSVNEEGKIYIEFGDDVNGKIPPNGTDIIVDYFYTNGSEGNVAENTITVLVGVVPLPVGVTLLCTNPNRASGGDDRETLSDLKRRIPLSFRTLNRAVTPQDHVDIALLTTGVAKAAVDWDCGRNIFIYIAPEGGGFPSNALLDDVEAWFEDKKIVGTNIVAKGAGEARVIIEATVRIKPNYSNVTENTTIKDRLVDFFSVDNQEIKGSLDLGNVYEVLETTPSVVVSEITKLHVKPFATPLYDTATPLDWDRTLNPGSTVTVRWVIKMVSTTVFQLFKNNGLVGTFSTGVAINLTEISFTVNGSYTVGEVWEFRSYKYFGSTQLEELSILTSFDTDITLNISGGI